MHMENPFIKIDSRLENIEVLLLDLKRHATQQPAKRDDATGEAAPVYVSKREAAHLIGVCTSTIDNAARAKKIRRHYVGKSVRFLRTEVLALAKANTNHKQTR